mgnify:CR=1 FL=1|jgi:hypothetical protein
MICCILGHLLAGTANDGLGVGRCSCWGEPGRASFLDMFAQLRSEFQECYLFDFVRLILVVTF